MEERDREWDKGLSEINFAHFTLYFFPSSAVGSH